MFPVKSPTIPSPAAKNSSTTAPITVTTNEAARLLGLSPMTLRNWRSKGVGPRYVHVSGPSSPVLYFYADLIEWADGLRK